MDLWPWIRPFRCQRIHLLQDFFLQKFLTEMVQIYFGISNFRSTAEETTITIEVESSWSQMTWRFSICLRLRWWCFLHRLNFLLLRLSKQKVHRSATLLNFQNREVTRNEDSISTYTLSYSNALLNYNIHHPQMNNVQCICIRKSSISNFVTSVIKPLQNYSNCLINVGLKNGFMSIYYYSKIVLLFRKTQIVVIIINIKIMQLTLISGKIKETVSHCEKNCCFDTELIQNS